MQLPDIPPSTFASPIPLDQARSGAETDPWRLTRSGHDGSRAAQHGSLFALCNGHLGVRGGLEEVPDAGQASFLAEVWESTPIDYHERMPGLARHTNTRVPVADGTRIRLRLGDEAVDLRDGQSLDAEQTLDLRAGCLHRRLRWRSRDGATLEVDAERIVPWNETALLCIRYRVRSVDYAGPVTLDSALTIDGIAARPGNDPRVGASVDGGMMATHCQADDAQASIGQETRFSHIRLACAQRHRLADHHLAFAVASTHTDGVNQCYVATLRPGASITLEKYVAYAWSKPDETVTHAALLETTTRALDRALARSFDEHLATQAACCAEFWRNVDLHIDGDPQSEQTLRLNLFHLRQSVARDRPSSPAAKGLTGEGYGGHHFWDSEVFMLPALVHLDPELARNILAWRVHTLDNARAHAREMNHARGALYPWRTIAGDECSAYFPAGSAQYHINADIAYALNLYVDATGDHTLLLEGGAEMLFETARLWLEVGRYSPRRDDAFCIFQVTGPDEYTVLVDNDFYTNHMAKKHLAYAADVADWLAQTYPATFTELQARTGLHADESAAWRQAAEAMYLPPPDERLGVFPQDDTFLDRPLPPESMVRKAADNLLLLDFHPLTIYRHQVCKQADVLHVLALTGEPADRDGRRRNFDYYETITTHDSTLSLPVFGIAAAQSGYPRKAWEYFQQALRIDVDNLHGNTSHGVHLAAMAGSWMNLTWGFGGCSLRDGTPTFAPSLPPAWRGYRFGFLWRGRRLRIAVDAHEVTYTLLEGQTLDIRHFDHGITLEPGCPQRHPLIDEAPAPKAFKGVIFDLDGVLADTATVHHAAWKKLAGELDLPFDDSLGARLKGVDRKASLEIILEGSSRMYSEAEKADLAERKNHYYREQIARFGPENLLPGARRAIEATRRAGLKTALASASRNAPMLLDRLGIRDLFDYIVDAGRIRHHKPNPEIFLAAAQGLGLDPTDCLGVEDAVAGVAAIRAAGMFAVGIGTGDELNDAEITLASIADFDADRLTADTHHTQRTTTGHAPDHDSIHHQPGRVSA